MYGICKKTTWLNNDSVTVKKEKSFIFLILKHMHLHILGSLAWNGDLLCSGSRDRVIIQRDVRCPETSEKKLVGHRQEVPPLKMLA